MPTLRLASAPKTRPTRTATTMPASIPQYGLQPRLSPFVLPFVVALPATNPAIPNIATCASETMPPKA